MSRRGLLIALIVSLAVNLFVLGGLAGAALMGLRLRDAPPPPGPPPRLAAIGAALDTPQREGWMAVIRQGAGASGPKLREARALRREAWNDLAESGDAPKALAKLGQSRALELQARSEMDRAVVTYAATLPQDERRKLAEALSRGRRHPPGGPSGDRLGARGERMLPDR